MKIKPGALCWIVRSSRPEWVGKVVTAVRYLDESFLFNQGGEPSYERGVWVIEADWLPPAPDLQGWGAPTSYLRPINDPDIDTTERDDALTDNLLDMLQYTKEAA